MFFKEVGDSLERKCNGLMQSEYLLPYVQCVFATELFNDCRNDINIFPAHAY